MSIQVSSCSFSGGELKLLLVKNVAVHDMLLPLVKINKYMAGRLRLLERLSD